MGVSIHLHRGDAVPQAGVPSARDARTAHEHGQHDPFAAASWKRDRPGRDRLALAGPHRGEQPRLATDRVGWYPVRVQPATLRLTGRRPPASSTTALGLRAMPIFGWCSARARRRRPRPDLCPRSRLACLSSRQCAPVLPPPRGFPHRPRPLRARFRRARRRATHHPGRRGGRALSQARSTSGRSPGAPRSSSSLPPLTVRSRGLRR